jgi:serine/threonine-protein kinase
MTPEQYKQVGDLYNAALELTPEDRVKFLDGACSGDDDLRREVESLLQARQEGGGFIAENLAAVAAEMAEQRRHQSFIGRSFGHYQVLSLLGVGGMGKVYLAEDTRLGRKVALKLLPAAFTQDPERVRRFKQEARAASSLNHPNILTIHEIGEASTAEGAAQYMVSEFVEGRTLRELLRGGGLDSGEVAAMIEQVASALSVAHEAGIIHRDIKPENLMARPDGLVKVLDFGLAKLTEGPRDRETDKQREAETLSVPTSFRPSLSTEPGMVMGTVSYMSPEQARGQKVDHRTDIFSLGVVLYEMIAGRRPFEGSTMSDVLAALLTADPPPLGQRSAEDSTQLERIAGKCLAKDREARYQSAAELIADLKALRQNGQTETSGGLRGNEAGGAGFAARRRTVVAALVAALIAALAGFLLWRRAPAIQPGQIKSLAVLPLENLTGDPTQEYFADGMTEALISNLTQVRALRVISRTSVMRFKGSRWPLEEIARELNVDAVIEGSVQRAGGRVKISARLIQPVNETLLRSFDYERELADVLKLQSDVARAVANEIRTQVTAEERARLASAPRVDPGAHEAYLLGRYYMRRQSEPDLKLAISHFERAIQLDATYAAAWAGMSIAWQQRGLWGATLFREAEQPARQTAIKALALDPGSAEGRASLGILKNRYDWDWAGSERDFRRSIELDPGSVEAHRFFAFLLTALGRHSEAINEIQTAEQLDPLSSLVQSDFAQALYCAQNYEQAERRLKRAIELDPLNYGAFGRLSYVYVEMGRYTEALASLEKAEAVQSGSGGNRSRYAATFALIYARMGRRKEAARILKQLLQTTDSAPASVRSVAGAWAALGNYDEAFKLLFNVIEKRNTLLIFTKVDPPLLSLHSDPRWKELIRRMNFPEEQIVR